MKAKLKLRQFLIACAAMCYVQAYAQDVETKKVHSKHYLSFGLGPSFSTNKHAGFRVEQKSNGTEYQHFVPTGYGQGFSLNLNYTYLINKELGLDFNISRLFGSSFQYENIYYSQGTGFERYKVQSKESFKANVWKFGISFVGRFNYASVSPYFKVGPIISAGNRLKRETTETYTEVTTGHKENGDFEIVSTGGTSFGFQSTVGIDIPLFDKEKLFVELNYTGLSHDFEKYELTKATYNGQNALPYISTDDKKGVYAETVSSTSNDELTFRAPLSSLSIMIGFRVALGN